MKNLHRITIGLSADSYKALTRVSDALGQSMSSVVSELVSEHSPIFDRMSEALEASKRLDAVALETKRAGFLAAQEKASRHYQAAMDAFAEATQPLIADSQTSKPKRKKSC